MTTSWARFPPTGGTRTCTTTPNPVCPVGRSRGGEPSSTTSAASTRDFFGMTEREATAIDPQHRLLLETSWDAFEHAGLVPSTVAGSQTGVFVGLTHGDYELLAAGSGAVEGPYGFSGTSNSFASGRVSYALGLHGPAVTVDTACSSGLMAVHQACRSLDDGESDLALAGGVAVALEPRKSVAGSLQGMLSPTGRCHAFDVAADGFVSGEGCVVLLLKRLPDAVRDGDRILAVIARHRRQPGRQYRQHRDAVGAGAGRGLSGCAGRGGREPVHDWHGRGARHRHPSRRPDRVREPGRGVRDRRSLCPRHRRRPTSGISSRRPGPLGLMKAILALQHGVVPQNLHFTRLPDELAEIKTELFVPQTSTPWPINGHQPRRAAVSSYGMSGTNVHAILEQAPDARAQGAGRRSRACVDAGGATAVSAVGHVRRRTARDVGPTGGVGRRAGDPADRGRARRSGLHPGASACAPAGAHGGARRQISPS